jgi:hypothetical protein
MAEEAVDLVAAVVVPEVAASPDQVAADTAVVVSLAQVAEDMIVRIRNHIRCRVRCLIQFHIRFRDQVVEDMIVLIRNHIRCRVQSRTRVHVQVRIQDQNHIQVRILDQNRIRVRIQDRNHIQVHIRDRSRIRIQDQIMVIRIQVHIRIRDITRRIMASRAGTTGVLRSTITGAGMMKLVGPEAGTFGSGLRAPTIIAGATTFIVKLQTSPIRWIWAMVHWLLKSLMKISTICAETCMLKMSFSAK